MAQADTAPQKPFGVPGAESARVDTPVGIDQEELRTARSANRFDIRRLIGGLFVLYGTILVLLGIFGSEHVKHKADGININLFTGVGMLVFGGVMIYWALARPVVPVPVTARGSAPAARSDVAPSTVSS